MSKSTLKLTDEQRDFWKLVVIRATDSRQGQPYIAHAIHRMTPANAAGSGTMGIDRRWNVYVDFDKFMHYTTNLTDNVKYAASYLAHEPWHPLRDFFRRVEQNLPQPVNSVLANVAHDLEINDDLKRLVTSDACFPETGTFVNYKANDFMEVYYKQLLEDPETANKFQSPSQASQNCEECARERKRQQQQDQQQGQDKGQQDGGQQDGNQPGQQPGQQGQPGDGGAGDQDGAGAGQPGGQGGQGQSGHNHGAGQGQGNQPGQGQGGQPGSGQGNGGSQPGGQGGQPGGHSHGGGAGDEHGEHTCGKGQGDGDKQIIGCGDMGEWELSEEEAPGLDEEEGNAVRRRVAEDVKKHEQSNPGSLPGWVRDWAGEVLAHTPVPWRQALRAQIRLGVNMKKGRMDYTMRRPNRRQPTEFLRPGMVSPVPNILVGCDTSGSNLQNLGIVVEEVQKLSQQMGVRGKDLRFFAVDVDVHKVKPVHDPKKVLNDVRLGGGTRMRPAYELAASMKGTEKPAVFILITDGEVYEEDFPNVPLDGMQNIHVVTVVMTDDRWSGNVMENANKRLSSWSKVIEVKVEHA